MPNGFASNWAYLKTELNWLERVLMLAVSRQRQDQKAVGRIAQSQADRVSAHWWKGLVSLDGKVGYDEHRPRSASTAVGYQQQLQARIEASRANGVVLLLPLLRDRLQLTLFEKNLLLMGLAPEVNRRYSRLYQYLQGTSDSELPTLELALRLLCRSDVDWQAARLRLTEGWSETGSRQPSPLLKHHLIQLVRPAGKTFLNASVQVRPRLVELLLSDESAVSELEALLGCPTGGGSAVSRSTAIDSAALPVQFSTAAPRPPAADMGRTSPVARSARDEAPRPAERPDPPSPDPPPTLAVPTWDGLILPDDLLMQLKYLSHRLTLQSVVDDAWGFRRQSFGAVQPGVLGILVGDRGTGKTLAAATIAGAMGGVLQVYDLRHVSPERWGEALNALTHQRPPAVLIKVAPRWFGAQPAIESLGELIAQRQQHPTLTLLTTHHLGSIASPWRHRADAVLSFPRPNEGDRYRLWKRAFPDGVPLGRLRWRCLASLPLTGGEIVALAREAAIVAAAEPSERIMQRHVSAALRWRGHQLPKKP